MSHSSSVGRVGAVDRDRSHTLFAETMGYVAVTAACFALGFYLGRTLSEGWAIVWFIVAFACLISMNFSVRRSGGLAGTPARLRPGPRPRHGADLASTPSTNPQALWQAGGATALLIAGFRGRRLRDPAGSLGLARLRFWALLALIVFGMVLIFVRIPHGSLIYSVLGLVVFAGLHRGRVQRLRRLPTWPPRR